MPEHKASDTSPQVPFDVAALSDEDYLYVCSDVVSAERKYHEAELVWSLAGLQAGTRVPGNRSAFGTLRPQA